MKRSLLSFRGALWALAGAALLAFIFYYAIGFPANVPVALGASVLLAELIEPALDGAGTSASMVVRAVVDGLLAGVAGWLGVMVVTWLGGLG